MQLFRTRSPAIAIVFGFATQLITWAQAQAGPGLAFLYDDVEITEVQCVNVGTGSLLSHDLQLPNHVLRINQSSIVGGENAEFTAVIDCSLIEELGRVQVTVSHINDSRKALELVTILLKDFQSSGESISED